MTKDDDRAGHERFRALFKSLPASAVLILGIYFLAEKLAAITGLFWVPPEWQAAVTVLGFGVSVTFFHRARLVRQFLEASAIREKERHDARSLTYSRGILAWTVALVAVGAYRLVEAQTRVEFEPMGDRLAGAFEWTDPKERPARIGRPFYWREGADLVHAGLPLAESPCHVFAVFPIGFPWTAQGRDKVENVSGIPGYDESRDEVRRFLLEQATTDMRTLLQGPESTWVAVTLMLYSFLHIVALAAMSSGFGYTFSLAEESIFALR